MSTIILTVAARSLCLHRQQEGVGMACNCLAVFSWRRIFAEDSLPAAHPCTEYNVCLLLLLPYPPLLLGSGDQHVWRTKASFRCGEDSFVNYSLYHLVDVFFLLIVVRCLHFDWLTVNRLTPVTQPYVVGALLLVNSLFFHSENLFQI